MSPESVDNAVYRERAHLVAHLAAGYPSALVYGADPLTPNWPVIFIRLPTGQVSWHISPDDLDLFANVERGIEVWDGHDTTEKYRRVDAHTRALAQTRSIKMLFPSMMRTIVPLAVGWVLTWLTAIGVDFSSEQVTSVVTVLFAGAYYTVFRVLERLAPKDGFTEKLAGFFLGYARPPEYPKPSEPPLRVSPSRGDPYA